MASPEISGPDVVMWDVILPAGETTWTTPSVVLSAQNSKEYIIQEKVYKKITWNENYYLLTKHTFDVVLTHVQIARGI